MPPSLLELWEVGREVFGRWYQIAASPPQSWLWTALPIGFLAKLAQALSRLPLIGPWTRPRISRFLVSRWAGRIEWAARVALAIFVLTTIVFAPLRMIADERARYTALAKRADAQRDAVSNQTQYGAPVADFMKLQIENAELRRKYDEQTDAIARDRETWRVEREALSAKLDRRARLKTASDEIASLVSRWRGLRMDCARDRNAKIDEQARPLFVESQATVRRHLGEAAVERFVSHPYPGITVRADWCPSYATLFAKEDALNAFTKEIAAAMN